MYVCNYRACPMEVAVGEIFGVGYAAVAEAVKRGVPLLAHNKKLQEKVTGFYLTFEAAVLSGQSA